MCFHRKHAVAVLGGMERRQGPFGDGMVVLEHRVAELIWG